jgi:hypothetical protein
MSLEEYFATGPERERPIFEVVNEFIESLGPVVVEPLSVGICFKRAGAFAYLLPMQRWETLGFSLPHIVRHRLMTRKPQPHGRLYYTVFNLTGPEDFDDAIKGWLAEAYFEAPG